MPDLIGKVEKPARQAASYATGRISANLGETLRNSAGGGGTGGIRRDSPSFALELDGRIGIAT